MNIINFINILKNVRFTFAKNFDCSPHVRRNPCSSRLCLREMFMNSVQPFPWRRLQQIVGDHGRTERGFVATSSLVYVRQFNPSASGEVAVFIESQRYCCLFFLQSLISGRRL